LDRQIGGIGTPEDAADIRARHAVLIVQIRSIADQPAAERIFAPGINRRDRPSRRQRDDPIATTVEERLGTDEKRVGGFVDGCLEGDIEIALCFGI